MATLVTGLGYIGSALAQRLLADGEEVVGLENFFSTPREAIAGLAEAGRFRLIEGSITDPEAVEQAFAAGPIGTVFHFASQASTHPDAAHVRYTQETNFTGPRIVLDACLQHGVKRVVFASSMRLYRTPLPPRIWERSPVEPTDLVHLSHLYGEILLEAYRRRGISGAAARLGIVHGLSPVMKRDPRFLAVPQRFALQAAHGETLRVATGPSSYVALVHVQDAVRGLLCLRDAPEEIAVANLACEVRGIAELAVVVQRAARDRGFAVGIEHVGRSRAPRAHQVTSALAPFGFSATRCVDESIGEALDHYLAVGGQGPGARGQGPGDGGQGPGAGGQRLWVESQGLGDGGAGTQSEADAVSSTDGS